MVYWNHVPCYFIALHRMDCIYMYYMYYEMLIDNIKNFTSTLAVCAILLPYSPIRFTARFSHYFRVIGI